MFLENNDVVVEPETSKGKSALYMLMRSYIEYECKRSRTFTQQRDLDKEVQNRLVKMFS